MSTNLALRRQYWAFLQVGHQVQSESQSHRGLEATDWNGAFCRSRQRCKSLYEWAQKDWKGKWSVRDIQLRYQLRWLRDLQCADRGDCDVSCVCDHDRNHCGSFHHNEHLSDPSRGNLCVARWPVCGCFRLLLRSDMEQLCHDSAEFRFRHSSWLLFAHCSHLPAHRTPCLAEN